jgi:hypothetical protein
MGEPNGAKEPEAERAPPTNRTAWGGETKQPRDELTPATPGEYESSSGRHVLTVRTGININNRSGTSDEIGMRRGRSLVAGFI